MRFNLKHFHSLHSVFCSVHYSFSYSFWMHAKMVCNRHTHTHIHSHRKKNMEIYIKYSQQIKGESFLVHDRTHFPIYLFGKYWVCWNDSLASLRAFHFPLAKFSIPFALSALNCKYCIEWAWALKNEENAQFSGSLPNLDHCMAFLTRCREKIEIELTFRCCRKIEWREATHT